MSDVENSTRVYPDTSRYMGTEKPQPGYDGGCWVLIRRYTGSLLPQGSHCSKRPRPGKLTCAHHAKHEATAQRTKKWLEEKEAADA